jgi:hypothetical protein
MRDWRKRRDTRNQSVPVARLGGMGKSAAQGEEDVLADSGRAGEKSDFFIILLGK